MNIAENLEKAIDIISTKGWRQGHSGEGFCAVDAIAEANRQGDWTATASYVADHVGDIFLFTWNDAPERTQEDVILTLKECAAKVREC